MNFYDFSDAVYFENGVYDAFLMNCDVDFIKDMMLLSKFEKYEEDETGTPCTCMSDISGFIKDNGIDVNVVCYVDGQGNIRPVTKNCMEIFTEETTGNSIIRIKNLS